MSESDIKTIILLIPYVFKGDTETEYTDKIAYVTVHYDELMQTLPMEVMQELSDRFVKEEENRQIEEEGLVIKAHRKQRTDRNKQILNLEKENKILLEQRNNLMQEIEMLRSENNRLKEENKSLLVQML